MLVFTWLLVCYLMSFVYCFMLLVGWFVDTVLLLGFVLVCWLMDVACAISVFCVVVVVAAALIVTLIAINQ